MQMLLIAPYPEMRDTVLSLLQRYPLRDDLTLRIEVVPVDHLGTISVAPCDVVIARGYTAYMLKLSHADMPMVEIDISGYDVMTSVRECRARFNSRKIAFIGFYGAFNRIGKFADLLGCGLNQYIPKSFDDLEKTLIQAVHDGCDAVIGGYSIHALAAERGIDSIGLHSGEESIGLALEEAVRVVDLLRQERIKAETYRIITQCVKDGIVYVDETGIIREDNLAARILACCSLKGRSLVEIFPYMEASFRELLREGKEILGELRQMGGATVSLDYMPVVVRDRSVGVVISFQNITTVQRRERQIRKKMHEKGLVAKYCFSDIVHGSKAMQDVIGIARRYALLFSNILITGETGTGKELFAQSIHNESARKDGPFVAVNCAALPENLLESELFGYEEGAFTGTIKGGKIGLFELAHGGTLFLDEIAEMPVGVQSKLLRVLQEREVRRIGGDKVIAVNVRIISATNRDLHDLVEHGQFRRDLFYRLNVFSLPLPPLRLHSEDVTALFLCFLKKICLGASIPEPAVQPETLELLHSYAFAGNIRELRNITVRACALCRTPGLISVQDMELAIHPDAAFRQQVDVSPAPAGAVDADTWMLKYARYAKETVRQHTLSTLSTCRGNRGEAARMLGINRSTLWRRLRDA